MKKLAVILLALIMVFSLAACGLTEEKKVTETSSEAESESSAEEEEQHEHSYTSEITDATCTTAGQEVFTCDCGDTYSKKIAAQGHVWGEWEVFKEATTEEVGENRRTCSVCKEYESELVPKIVEEVENFFFNDTNNYYDEGVVSIRPRYVYWENGKLIAECFVINGLNKNVYDIDVENIAFSNADGDIAEGSFGLLQDAVIDPYTHVIWRFEFTEDCVFNAGAALVELNYSCDVSYKY